MARLYVRMLLLLASIIVAPCTTKSPASSGIWPLPFFCSERRRFRLASPKERSAKSSSAELAATRRAVNRVVIQSFISCCPKVQTVVSKHIDDKIAAQPLTYSLPQLVLYFKLFLQKDLISKRVEFLFFFSFRQ